MAGRTPEMGLSFGTVARDICGMEGAGGASGGIGLPPAPQKMSKAHRVAPKAESPKGTKLLLVRSLKQAGPHPCGSVLIKRGGMWLRHTERERHLKMQAEMG